MRCVVVSPRVRLLVRQTQGPIVSEVETLETVEALQLVVYLHDTFYRYKKYFGNLTQLREVGKALETPISTDLLKINMIQVLYL